MFFQILGSTAEQDSKKVGNGTQYGYDVTTTGFAMGTDAANENGDVFGVSFSMSNSDLDGKGTGKSTNDTDTYIASIYGDKILERGFLESVFSLGYSENSTSRLVNTSGLNRSYKGDYDSSHAGFKLGAGSTKEIGVSNDGYKSYITPFVSIAGSYVSTDAYTESSSLAGDNLSLKIEQDDLLSLVGTIGFRAAKETERGTPSFSIAIDNEFGDDTVKSTNKYQGGAGDTFVTSTEMEALSARIGLGYSFGSDLKSFNFDYEAEVNNDDYLGHTGSFSFTSKF
jgi:uncharacterized protein with beta-barrel porin domain